MNRTATSLQSRSDELHSELLSHQRRNRELARSFRDLEGPQIERSVDGSRFVLAVFDVLVLHRMGIGMKRRTGVHAWGLPNEMVVLPARAHESWSFALDVSSFVVNVPGQTAVAEIKYHARSDPDRADRSVGRTATTPWLLRRNEILIPVERAWQ